MPRLQILHHKSYHPYNEKNKQRVREDEAKARAEELAREQRTIDAESEARLNALRRRAGSPGVDTRSDDAIAEAEASRQREEKARAREKRQRERLDFDFPSETKKRKDRRDGGGIRDGEREQDGRGLEDRFQTGGHLNFWADLESGHKPAPSAPPTAAEIAKRKVEEEADKFTMYLGRPDRETKPWYTDRELKRVEEKEGGGDEAEYRRARDRRRDVRAKDRNDPLTDIKKSLAAQTPPNRSSRPRASASASAGRSGPGAGSASGMSERERAMALLAKKSSASGGSGGGGGSRGWESPGGDTWHDALERQKDTAGNRYHADTWDRRRSARDY